MSTMYVKARRASAQTITNNTRTKVTGLSLNEVDPLGAPSPWNNGTQKMVATSPGICTVTPFVEWSGEQAGPHLIEAVITRAADGSTERLLISQVDGDWSTTATTGLVQTGSRDVRLEVDDTVEMYVRQISGATQEIAQAELTVCWIRA